MKPRSKTDFQQTDPPVDSYYRVYRNNVLQSETAYPVGLAYNVERTLHGWDLEDYHKRKAKGELLPFTPFDQVEHLWENPGLMSAHWSLEYMSGSDLMKEVWNPWAYSASYINAGEPAEEILSSLPDMDYYVQAAAARIYASGHDTLTFLGELKDTRKMFEKTWKRVLDIRRGIYKRERISDVYLEARYGWRPLKSDLNDLVDAFVNLNSSRKRYSERAGTSYTKVLDTSYEVDTPDYTFSISRTETYNVSVRGSVVADIDPPSFAFNPVTSAWELTKLSFVVDWLINVGQALEAMSFLVYSSNHQAGYGYQIQRNVESSGSITANKGAGTYQAAFNDASSTRWTMRAPASVKTIPQIKLRLDDWKAFDLLALVQQLK
jgi:hypothetical protein